MVARLYGCIACTYIKHVVVIVQENRSFENMFAGWPGADAPTYGYLHTGKRVALHSMTYAGDCVEIKDYQYCDMGHLWQQALRGWNHGKMNGFDLNRYGPYGTGPLVHQHPYAYLDHAEIAPYRELASQYVLADHMFPTEFGTSFTAHQDLIAGTTRVDDAHSLVNVPLPSPPWGCTAAKGTTTPLVDRERKINDDGPFPCLSYYPTIADTLDAAGVAWKYYAPPLHNPAGGVWSAFSAIKDVYYGQDWKRNVVSPETKVFGDAKNDALPSVAWVIPDFKWSDHPTTPSNWGPSWVADVVNAIGRSSAWNTTAIVLLWDDWGGWYDSAPPPHLDYVGLGLRVPCIVISPYVKRGVVSHTRYEYGSILKFIEQTFKLQSLGSTDERANSLDAFDFTQKPRAFVPIPTRHGPDFFRRQHPSEQPPDSE